MELHPRHETSFLFAFRWVDDGAAIAQHPQCCADCDGVAAGESVARDPAIRGGLNGRVFGGTGGWVLQIDGTVLIVAIVFRVLLPRGHVRGAARLAAPSADGPAVSASERAEPCARAARPKYFEY